MPTGEILAQTALQQSGGNGAAAFAWLQAELQKPMETRIPELRASVDNVDVMGACGILLRNPGPSAAASVLSAPRGSPSSATASSFRAPLRHSAAPPVGSFSAGDGVAEMSVVVETQQTNSQDQSQRSVDRLSVAPHGSQQSADRFSEIGSAGAADSPSELSFSPLSDWSTGFFDGSAQREKRDLIFRQYMGAINRLAKMAYSRMAYKLMLIRRGGDRYRGWRHRVPPELLELNWQNPDDIKAGDDNFYSFIRFVRNVWEHVADEWTNRRARAWLSGYIHRDRQNLRGEKLKNHPEHAMHYFLYDRVNFPDLRSDRRNSYLQKLITGKRTSQNEPLELSPEDEETIQRLVADGYDLSWRNLWGEDARGVALRVYNESVANQGAATSESILQQERRRRVLQIFPAQDEDGDSQMLPAN
eukprot:g1713.t1